MVPLNSPELKRIAGFLEKYDLKPTISQLGGLLTAPSLQANTIRIESLVHLAVAHCNGRRKPGLTEIDHWLNKQLGNTRVALLEDPAEDVFVTNVMTPNGNRRVFEGIWESNDYFVQVALEVLGSRRAPQECRDLLVPSFALLTLSDCVAERVGLQRWHIEPSSAKGTVRLVPAIRVEDRARAITFTDSELEGLGINRVVLEPFIFRDEDKQALLDESVGHSSLERRPLVDFSDELILALPPAVSPAIRRFILTELMRMGYLQAFSEALAARQAIQVEQDGLQEIKGKVVSLEPPSPSGKTPSLHGWLLKYDISKYIHIVLLHDWLEGLEAYGLSSFLEYPEDMSAGLEGYLSKVSKHCQSLPDFAEGMTLLVVGGLGRGFALGFNGWTDKWRLSVIRISDLLMLASETDRPITHYLKCIKQKRMVENEGFRFENINGDYNLYCYWSRTKFQLVPHDLPVGDRSILVIATDNALPVREEIRKLVDRHALEITSGHYLPVVRFGMDAFFKSLRSRPIYASLSHVRAGVLAGAIETPRGPSWLLIKPRRGDQRVKRLLYELWSGFINLYDKLVFEVEALYPETPAGVIEIRLDFDNVIVSEDYKEHNQGVKIGEPEVSFNLEQRTSEIKFTPDFLTSFQQPENIGEKLTLKSIAKSLVSIHQGSTAAIGDAVLDSLIQKVMGDSGIRVIHLFPTNYPIEHLLSRQGQKPIFLPHEDFVFSKLKLSEGCTAARSGTILASKEECNDFLHRVVDKLWNIIRKQLQHLDRASVIREALKAHEASINDRDRWRRTSQAVLALYAAADDVLAVAQERELDRINVSLPARTILEMAICECPVVGGRQLSRWELDELLAKVALLIEVATDSDAIYSDLLEAKIELHLNGEYTLNHEFHNTVSKPFLAAYFREGFESAAKAYDMLYERVQPGEERRAEDIYSADFINAFQSEYGLTPDEAIDGFAELMELAVETDSVVVETALGDLKARLTTVREMSYEACQAFIKTFSIFHRPAWDKPPAGFSNKDLNPWRYRRRLSATVRPIFIFGEQDEDKVFFGAGALRLGLGYLLGRSEKGHLPQEFFTSPAMRQYIGAVNDERGHAFARSVAEKLKEKGWQIRNEVSMAELGGPAKLGDIDVLAWSATGEVQIIECKRLQLARTVAEIAEICRRFRGEAKDELAKHVRRVTWIVANPAGLQRIVGFKPDPAGIDDRLVTDTLVPMTYLKGLPIEADKIGPLK